MLYKLEHIDIEINHRCNLMCRHCSAKAGDGFHSGELSSEEIKTILSNARPLGLRKVGLTGGEPLFDVRKLEEVARFCVDELHLPIHTHFNGTMITEELCKSGGVISLFKSASITFLGGNAATHDFMTGVKGSFDKGLEGVRLMVRYDLPLTVYYIPTRGTCASYKELTPTLHALGVKRIRAMALAPSGRARTIYEATAPPPEEMIQFEIDLLEVRDTLKIHIEAGYCTRLSMPRLQVLSGHEVCMSGRNRVHINSAGNVFPCTAASGVEELKLGNLKEVSWDISDIWNNSDLLQRRRAVHLGKVDACENCPIEVKCKQGCLVNACGTMSDDARRNCPVLNTLVPA